MQSHLHIISFDVPFPANYGGVIDVFHKIRCLHEKGIKVILHCFVYGSRKPSKELEHICEKVYYYNRNVSIFNQLSYLPFNVKSRIDKELKKNLLKDNYPILFEVLHSCYLLADDDLKNRKKLYRHSNIEHEYFNELAKAESSFFKKIYLKLESFKLKKFEKTISHADCILAVSEKDLEYFKKTYPHTPSVYLPSFHPYDHIQSKPGNGNNILYHGNLSVSENYTAAHWLIDHVFSKITHPVIIAGLNPPNSLIEKIKLFNHIELKANCTENEMQSLIENAQLHCLSTAQETGLKLKLLNVLFSGRFVICNPMMLAGTNLGKACEVCVTANDYFCGIKTLFKKEFTTQIIEKRRLLIAQMKNDVKTKHLIDIINS